MHFESITRNNDFHRAYKRGKCINHSHLVVYAFKKKWGGLRVGITASKKIGNAVTRNRARRVVRHALYALPQPEKANYDLVFVAKHRTPLLKSTQLERTMAKLLTDCGVFPDQGKKKAE